MDSRGRGKGAGLGLHCLFCCCSLSGLRVETWAPHLDVIPRRFRRISGTCETTCNGTQASKAAVRKLKGVHPLRWRWSLCSTRDRTSAAALLFVVPTALWAQSVPRRAWPGIRAGSADAAFNVGWSNLPNKLENTRSFPIVGASGGINISRHVAAIGEYTYQFMSRIDAVSLHTQLFGGAARLSLSGKRVVPYVLLGGGGASLTASEPITSPTLTSSISATASGGYFAAAGGATIFMGRSWGLRPEFRYNYVSLSYGGQTSNNVNSAHVNSVQIDCGVFFQFGGKARRN